MTEREVNIEYVKNKFRKAKLTIPDEKSLNLICDLLSESYIDGLRQGHFDIIMDMQCMKERGE